MYIITDKNTKKYIHTITLSRKYNTLTIDRITCNVLGRGEIPGAVGRAAQADVGCVGAELGGAVAAGGVGVVAVKINTCMKEFR